MCDQEHAEEKLTERRGDGETGIGVDDMFVLCGALDRAPRHLSLEDRIGYMMRTSGTSITLTSLTDCVAFALGTTTSFPVQILSSILRVTFV